ncbi:MAG: thiamine phosphate synthase [Spirochaetales bacterium]
MSSQKNQVSYPLLYLVTDRDLALGRSLLEVVAQAVEGGANIVQLREKSLDTRLFIEEAIAIKEYLKPRGIPLIINDRVDVALAVGADGVHVGQKDMPYALARKLLGPQAIIGLSVETYEDLLQAESLDVDYLGVGPVYPTSTKTDHKGFFWKEEGLRWAREHSRHRLVAIGGINETNALEVVKTGVDGIAVVSAIVSASDPRQAARRLFQVLTNKEAQV